MLPGGFGAQNECFCKFGKKVFLDPWRQEGGLGGSSPHSRVYLAPWHQEGGLGGSSPQLAKTGYHTRLINFVQYFMEESVCMVSEGHVEPVDE